MSGMPLKDRHEWLCQMFDCEDDDPRSMGWVGCGGLP